MVWQINNYSIVSNFGNITQSSNSGMGYESAIREASLIPYYTSNTTGYVIDMSAGVND